MDLPALTLLLCQHPGALPQPLLGRLVERALDLPWGSPVPVALLRRAELTPELAQDLVRQAQWRGSALDVGLHAAWLVRPEHDPADLADQTTAAAAQLSGWYSTKSETRLRLAERVLREPLCPPAATAALAAAEPVELPAAVALTAPTSSPLFAAALAQVDALLVPNRAQQPKRPPAAVIDILGAHLAALAETDPGPWAQAVTALRCDALRLAAAARTPAGAIPAESVRAVLDSLRAGLTGTGAIPATTAQRLLAATTALRPHLDRGAWVELLSWWGARWGDLTGAAKADVRLLVESSAPAHQLRLERLGAAQAEAASYLVHALGEDTTAWEVLLGLLPGFSGRLEDLVTAVTGVARAAS